MTVLLCPLCSQPRFTSLDSLKFNLIKAATQNISCPICSEVLVGLDKLTIHLFGHSLSAVGDSIDLKAHKNENSLLEANHVDSNLDKREENVENGILEGNDKDDDKDEGCTINMEDLGFLTTLDTCLRTEGLEELEGNTGLQSEAKETVEIPKEDNSELSEYMSDLLNKKLPLLNFVRESSRESASQRTMEVEEGGRGDSERFKYTERDSTFENGILLSMHHELNHSIPDETKEKDNESGNGNGLLTLHSTTPNENLIKDLVLPRYDCHLCKKSFKMKGSLLVHYKVAHFGPDHPVPSSLLPNQEENDEKNFRCYICSKSFKKDQLLTQHIKTHEGKQWRCDTCNKSFTTKYFLKKHQRLHTGEMPYSCQTCKKTFTFQQSYRKHLLYHSDEKPHKCTQCGRAFKELSTLHNHQRIHSGEKPFACESCGKCFRQRVSYIVHQRIHTGVLPYECTACRKKFRYKVSQRSHKCSSQVPGSVVRASNELVQPIVMNTSDVLLCSQ